MNDKDRKSNNSPQSQDYETVNQNLTLKVKPQVLHTLTCAFNYSGCPQGDIVQSYAGHYVIKLHAPITMTNV